MAEKKHTKKATGSQMSVFDAAEIIFGGDLRSTGFLHNLKGFVEIGLPEENHPETHILPKLRLPKGAITLAKKQDRTDPVHGELDGQVYYVVNEKALIRAAEKKQSKTAKS